MTETPLFEGRVSARLPQPVHRALASMEAEIAPNGLVQAVDELARPAEGAISHVGLLWLAEYPGLPRDRADHASAEEDGALKAGAPSPSRRSGSGSR